MPGRGRAHQQKWLRGWLGAWLAALLAIGQLGQPFGPGAPAGMSIGSNLSSVSADDGLSPSLEPVAGLRTGPSAPPGVISRLSLVETALGLPPVKPPLLKPSAGAALPAVVSVTARHGLPTDHVVHRGAVGTARTPTGPPL